MIRILIFIGISISLLVFAETDANNVAIVKMLRGKVQVISADGVSKELAKGDWITEGSVIKTQARSFCKLSFIDKSSMNIGPKSEMKIEKFSKTEAGVINVISGKIRSKVTKDYLKMDKGKSKVFIKSKSAVMGVRGTEYMFSANRKNGAATAVLFEGEVVFNRLEKGTNNTDLESVVSSGRKIKPGQFSVVSNKFDRPTVPAKMNKLQFTALEKNTSMGDTKKASQSQIQKSVVPPGLSGAIVSGNGEGLKKDLLANIVKNVDANMSGPSPEKLKNSMGYVDGRDVKPADGTIIHIESGTMISPGSDSKFDQNTNEWVSTSIGNVDDKGNYVPPEGYRITEDGDLLKEDKNSGKVQKVILDIKPIDQLPPLDRLPVVDFDSSSKNQTENKRPEQLINGIKANCDKGDCLPPPPVCEGCGIIPTTFLNGAPSNTTNTTARPKTPVQINIRKN